VILALVGAASLVAFSPALQNEFVHWDDYDNYVNNRHIRSLSPQNFAWMATSKLLAVWQPLTWLLTALEYQLADAADSAAFRAVIAAVSLALHAACGVLCYLLSARLLRLAMPMRADRSPGGLRFVSAMAALLFLVHPLRCETVAWASGQPYLFAAAACLASLWCYLKAHETGHRRWHLLALALLAASLLCKSIAVPLWAAFLVLDWYPLRRIGGDRGWSWPLARQLLVEKLPYFLVTCAAVAFAVWATWTSKTYPADPPLVKALVVCYCVAFYVAKTILPVGLAPYYARPQPITTVTGDPWFITAALAVAAAALAAFVLRRRAPWLTASVLIYAAFILPVAGFVKHGGQLAADRYAYLSCIPWALLAAAGLLRLWRVAASPAAARNTRRCLFVVGAVAISALAADSRAYCRSWKDSITLWTAMLDRNPAWHMGYYNLAKRYKAKGDMETAERLYLRGIEIYPLYPEANVDLGNLLFDRGDLDGAVDRYERALRGRKDFHMAHYNIARVLMKRGRFDEAGRHLRLAELDAQRSDPAKLPMIRGQLDAVHRVEEMLTP